MSLVNISVTDLNQKHGRTVAFDFDGVIAQYSGFVSSDDTREPVSETVQAIRELKSQGYKILIHSTRADAFLKKYCDSHDIPYDFINTRPDKQGDNPGKPIAYVYVDDRAICYRGQTAEDLVKEITFFKAWWQS